MSTLQEIKSVDEWDAHLGSLDPSTLLIASFHAPWAAPCAQMTTVLQALADEYPPTPTPATTSWVSLNAEDLSDAVRRNARLVGYVDVTDAGILRNRNTPRD